MKFKFKFFIACMWLGAATLSVLTWAGLESRSLVQEYEDDRSPEVLDRLVSHPLHGLLEACINLRRTALGPRAEMMLTDAYLRHNQLDLALEKIKMFETYEKLTPASRAEYAFARQLLEAAIGEAPPVSNATPAARLLVAGVYTLYMDGELFIDNEQALMDTFKEEGLVGTPVYMEFDEFTTVSNVIGTMEVLTTVDADLRLKGTETDVPFVLSSSPYRGVLGPWVGQYMEDTPWFHAEPAQPPHSTNIFANPHAYGHHLQIVASILSSEEIIHINGTPLPEENPADFLRAQMKEAFPGKDVALVLVVDNEFDQARFTSLLKDAAAADPSAVVLLTAWRSIEAEKERERVRRRNYRY